MGVQEVDYDKQMETVRLIARRVRQEGGFERDKSDIVLDPSLLRSLAFQMVALDAADDRAKVKRDTDSSAEIRLAQFVAVFGAAEAEFQAGVWLDPRLREVASEVTTDIRVLDEQCGRLGATRSQVRRTYWQEVIMKPKED